MNVWWRVHSYGDKYSIYSDWWEFVFLHVPRYTSQGRIFCRDDLENKPILSVFWSLVKLLFNYRELVCHLVVLKKNRLFLSKTRLNKTNDKMHNFNSYLNPSLFKKKKDWNVLFGLFFHFFVSNETIFFSNWLNSIQKIILL